MNVTNVDNTIFTKIIMKMNNIIMSRFNLGHKYEFLSFD